MTGWLPGMAGRRRTTEINLWAHACTSRQTEVWDIANRVVACGFGVHRRPTDERFCTIDAHKPIR
jgi:hypothetical protein